MKKNYFKLGMVAIALLSASVVSAQDISADIARESATTLAQRTALGDGGSVRLVDNKGTIKYLQVKNGLTQVTNTSTNGAGITTTWQLGGTLSNDTYIDVKGNNFSLDGIPLLDGTTVAASTDATDLSINAANANGTTGGVLATGTGWTILVRDEATGAINKMLLSDLVKGGTHNSLATTGSDFTFTDPLLPNDLGKISVYRNGAKMLAGVDYSIAGAVGSVTVTVTSTGGAAPEDYFLITGDRMEVQWIH